MDDSIAVDVCYALRDRQDVVHLRMPAGSTAQQAVEASGLLQRHPEIDLAGANKLGVFARLVRADTLLRDKDRVEIYRPLASDPKEVRRKRAEEGKAVRKGGGAMKGTA